MYKGIEITDINNYIFDTTPYNEEIDLNETRRIESLLRDYTNGYTQDGITYEEAFKFLDWVTYNARSFATNNTPESAMTSPLTGKCSPTQRLNVKILQKIGLDVIPFNMGECVGKTPMNALDIQRINNGFSSPNVRHAVAMVNIPIKDNEITTIHKYLLDPTFRQFCLKENCNTNEYFNDEKLNKGYVAPHPGYFLSKEFLEANGEGEDKIKNSEYVATVLINKGYMELTEENAKTYGDAFARAGIRREFKDSNLPMTGMDYVREFEQNKENIFEVKDNNFARTPLEIEEEKSLLDKIKDFFKRFDYSKKRKLLPEAKKNKLSERNKREQFLNKYEIKQNLIIPNLNTKTRNDRGKDIR